VLIIGGTRGTGLLTARLLQEKGESVRILARDHPRARTLFDASVDVVQGDIINPATLRAAIDGAHDIIFTAGCRSGYPVRQTTVKATEYHGVLNTLEAAARQGFAGRFIYMTSSGVNDRSFWTAALNAWKGNTLIWRARVEEHIRSSGLHYAIVRAGFLLNRPGGQHRLEVTQSQLPLSPRWRVARADVAAVLAAALGVRAVNLTFEVVWGERGERQNLNHALDLLVPDTRRS
jgi:uncharacterized protein YbjT (DUF2867 family)